MKRGAKEVNKKNTSMTLGTTEDAMKEKSSAEKRKAHLQSLVKEESASVLSSRRMRTKRFNRACTIRE